MFGDKEKIGKVVKYLKRAEAIFFVTGAGISADSGLPTYRGVGGLYNNRTTDDGMPIETALSGQMFAAKPEVTWKYLFQIEKNCRGATFNRAHEVIAKMEKYFSRVWVITQNIDGFHFDAGSDNVIDIHGDYRDLICTRCGWSKKVKNYSGLKIPPICPECNGLVRPNVVFFGEMLPIEKIQLLGNQLSKGFDLYFSVGTTSVFPYIREPMAMAKRLNKATIEINPEDTEISGIVDIKLKLGASQALGRIWKEYKRNKKDSREDF